MLVVRNVRQVRPSEVPDPADEEDEIITRTHEEVAYRASVADRIQEEWKAHQYVIDEAEYSLVAYLGVLPWSKASNGGVDLSQSGFD